MDQDLYYFDSFRIDGLQRVLFKNDTLVDLTQKEFELLFLLVKRAPAILSKNVLLSELWTEEAVDESNVGHHVKALRTKLSNGTSNGTEFIGNLRGRGYYFARTVSTTPPARVAVSVTPPTVADNEKAATSPVPTSHLGRIRVAPWRAFAAALFVIVVAVLIYWATRRSVPYPRPTVAVFSFKNSTAVPSAEWLSSSFANMFRTDLGATGVLRTIPTEDVERAAAELSLPPVDSFGMQSLTRIRDYLHADYVLLGSYVQLSSGQIRVDIKLQDTRTGDLATSVSNSGSTRALFDLVSRSVVQLTSTLRARSATPGANRAADALPKSAEASRLYAEGLTKLHRYDTVAASQLLSEAATLEPHSPLIHAALAEAWASLGYRQKAEEEAKKAVDFSTSLPREQNLEIQARYREILRDWEGAIELYQSLWTVFPDNPEHALRLANAQTSAHKGTVALRTLAELRQKLPGRAADPRVDLAEAIVQESLGDSQAELAAAKRAMGNATRIGARLLAAQAQLRACWALDILSRWDEASKFATTARQTFADFGDRSSEAHAVKNMADVMDDRGDHRAAVEVYKEAIAIYRDIGQQDGIAVTLNNLGEAYRSLGDLDSAKKSYQESAQIAATIGDWKLQAIVLNGVGSILWRRGDLAGAQAAYEKAVAGVRMAADKDLLTNSLMNLAEVFQDEGYLDDALKLFEDALGLANQLGDRSSAARILGNIGELLVQKGDLMAAKKRFSDQLVLADKIPDEKQSAYGLQGLGEVALMQGEIKDARSKYQQSLELRLKLKENGLVAETRLAQAELELEEEQYSLAAAEARAAVLQFTSEEEFDQQAVASAIIALALDPHSKEALTYSLRATTLLPTVKDVARRLAITIDLAHVNMRRGSIRAARSDLRVALNEAYKLRYVPQQLEIRYLLCQAEPLSCTPELEHDAREKGFLYIAEKAAKVRLPASTAQRR